MKTELMLSIVEYDGKNKAKVLGNKSYEIKDNKIPNELVNNFIKVKDISTERYNGKIMTVMRYELINGFVGIESTSCVDEKNYREDIGEEILTKRR